MLDTTIGQMDKIISDFHPNCHGFKYAYMAYMTGKPLPTTDAEIIKSFNAFWRNHCYMNHEDKDTVEIRSWLSDGDSIVTYLSTFQHHIYPLIISSGCVL